MLLLLHKVLLQYVKSEREAHYYSPVILKIIVTTLAQGVQKQEVL